MKLSASAVAGGTRVMSNRDNENTSCAAEFITDGSCLVCFNLNLNTH